MDEFRRGELVFDVIDAEPADGPVVVLLHGFPQQNTMWQPIIPRLTAGDTVAWPLASAVTPDKMADLLLDWFAAHPATSG